MTRASILQVTPRLMTNPADLDGWDLKDAVGQAHGGYNWLR